MSAGVRGLGLTDGCTRSTALHASRARETCAACGACQGVDGALPRSTAVLCPLSTLLLAREWHGLPVGPDRTGDSAPTVCFFVPRWRVHRAPSPFVSRVGHAALSPRTAADTHD
ncbi:hypothetical protein FRAHR75_1250005 [Frankia sp. Hr75.2]|nr:hypothetical protein FRAHR75_1250005 [Frankia sp. Hr75.2]SQE00522.1 hypothetical protein FMEAI12_6680023 [Parafrankia sp. Ea1.12]